MSTLPPLRALQVFEAVGRYASVTEAAGWLGISPAAVSQQLRQLETHLGISLVERDGRRLRLTREGERYHVACAAAFEELRVASAAAEQARRRGGLGVSALPSLMAQWLTPHLGDWHRQHPEVGLYLDGSHAEPDWAGREIDFRITYSDRAREAANRADLFRDLVVPACHPALLEDARPQGRAEALLKLPLIGIDWQPKFSSPPSWGDWFAAVGVKLPGAREHHRVYSLSAMAIQAAVAQDGIVLAQYAMIQAELAAGTLVLPCLRPLWMPSAYYLTWPTGAFDSAHGRELHRWLLHKGREQAQAGEALMRQAEAGAGVAPAEIKTPAVGTADDP